MTKLILILFASALLCSCNSQKKEEAVDHANEQNIVEKYFPAEKESKVFDTTIVSSNLSITIKSQFLDSYVSNQFESDDTTHIHKYRDSEKQLTVKMEGKTIMDTSFKKEDFIELTGQDFLETANLFMYKPDGFYDDRIQFIGSIGVPETDASLRFTHIFHLESKTFITEKINSGMDAGY